MVTPGSFTKPAITFADTKANVRLIDGEEVVRLVLQHYEDLDSRYKGLIPLKRVYVPQAIEDDSGDA
jgi:restriction system protein